MRDSEIVPETSEGSNLIEEITLEDVITAPEDKWRELCKIIDANLASMERARARRRLKDNGQFKPKRRSSRRQSRRPSTSRNWSAGSVFQSQALIGEAMVESLTRVNEAEEVGSEPTRAILVTAGDDILIMEVVE